MNFWLKLFLLFSALLLAGCIPGERAGLPPSARGESLVASLARCGLVSVEVSQVLLVTAHVSSSVEVSVIPFEKHGGRWIQAMPPMPGVIGKNGFALAGEKQEGDGRTPSGIYRLERAFGDRAESPTRLDYRQATADDLWVDDVNSPDYNRRVQRGETSAVSFEEMRRPDDLYRYGIVVEYNTDPVVPGKGSAIFFHLWKGEGVPTAGCVALAEPDLLRILGWLDPAKKPVTVMGNEETLQAISATLKPSAG